MSSPVASRPDSSACTSVVPEPANGSRTCSPGARYRSSSASTSCGMNLPWYGWRRWTCFVRSRSRSSASDQERSRSSVAYSSSWVTATRRDSTRPLERLRKSLHAAVAHGDHVEADGEASELGTGTEPGLGGAAEASLLLGGQHLERIAEARALLLLHLDKS